MMKFHFRIFVFAVPHALSPAACSILAFSGLID